MKIMGRARAFVQGEQGPLRGGVYSGERQSEGRVGEGLGRDLRLGMLSWSSWGFCLPRALLEGTGASRFSVFTGVITHTHIDTHTDTHIHIATHTHTHTHTHTEEASQS